jgi:hypothetical protein
LHLLVIRLHMKGGAAIQAQDKNIVLGLDAGDEVFGLGRKQNGGFV